MKTMKRLLSSLMFLTAVVAPALAQTPGGTLAKIKGVGEIRLGHRDVSVPFSYLDDNQKPVGFAMDLCARIVDAVKDELKLPTLQTRLQPIQLSTQIPLIENGTIDIVCGPATNTLERQKVVAFSNTIFVSSIRAVVRKDAPIKTFEDLKDKPVALTTGSTSITLLLARSQEKRFEVKQVLSPDHAASFLALTTGRSDAFVMDDILLAGLIASSQTPDNWRIIDDSLRTEPYGLIIRKGDPDFKALVDKTLGAMMKNGQFAELYAKWFTKPIPPKNVNLNFPMPAPLKDAVANPNDRGV
ncbi:transporter substrate-binding domain-containing protein [Bradyrhizobium sp. 521_C7_N1_3]|uniref:transporter substrate-binding domain-containing protein n=1 Tax=Bradyrhizobium TaxID=374 RepID=UPI002714C0B5|nr:transporter substrate-binding domain-containing protein [Bradyrhizobium japonicum]WLB52130.1 transporter substrate-binding domain-containing protein [Bradyrhizobium japonicum]WLB66098.1 transporter substrate-binding domain-containing protein [Bradyrhizobium japonicum]